MYSYIPKAKLLKRWFISIFLFIYVILIYGAVFHSNARCKTTMFKHMDPAYDESIGCYGDQQQLRQAADADLEQTLPRLGRGGSFTPMACRAKQQHVALIIPFSHDRKDHLDTLLPRLHVMLRRQRVRYKIYVTEQVNPGAFNKGLVMNTAVVEALKEHEFDCFIFHDVDLLPENDRNIYYCDLHLRHLSPAINEMRYHPLYSNLAGGVISINKDNFFKYWGWGAEDDDFNVRTKEIGLLMTRPPEYIGRYRMIRHKKRSKGRLSHAYDMLITWKSRWKKDGLNSLRDAGGRVLEIRPLLHYTHIQVNTGKIPDEPVFDKNTERQSYFWFLKYYFE